MSKKDSIDVADSKQTIMKRHKAVAGTLTGAEAAKLAKEKPNSDPSEAVFEEGEYFIVPSSDTIDDYYFVAPLGSGAHAVAVDMVAEDGTPTGQSKVLYLSSLRKSVFEYTENADGEFVPVKDENGVSTKRPHVSDTPLYRQVMSCATYDDIKNLIAGKKIHVKSVDRDIVTSKLAQVIDPMTGSKVWKAVGLRTTSVPFFEAV